MSIEQSEGNAHFYLNNVKMSHTSISLINYVILNYYIIHTLALKHNYLFLGSLSLIFLKLNYFRTHQVGYFDF